DDIKTNTAPKEPEQQAQQRPTFDYSQVYAEQPQPQQRTEAPQPQQAPHPQQPAEQPAAEKKPPRGGGDSTGGDLWGDV
ncbi:hypothetical protein NY407_26390, partial [Enterobacter hormaechei]|nr:hypothetical protein [Enterobacter hormaechei]